MSMIAYQAIALNCILMQENRTIRNGPRCREMVSESKCFRARARIVPVLDIMAVPHPSNLEDVQECHASDG